VAHVVVDVPRAAPRLVFAYGVNPERWLDAPSGPFTFTVEVEKSAPPVRFQATMDPHHVLADRRWVDVALDLAPYAGRRVTLAFTIEAPAEPAKADELAGWADPRVLGR
jgi:hypothetical protein